MTDDRNLQPRPEGDGPHGFDPQALERFESHLPLLERVVSQVLASTGASVRDMVYLGAIVLLRCASEWDETVGLPFKEYAEVTITSELLHHAHYPVPVLRLPPELTGYQPRLNAIAQALASFQPKPLSITTYSGMAAGHPALAGGYGYAPYTDTMASAAPTKTESIPAMVWRLFKKRLPLIMGLVLATEIGITAFTVTSPKTWVSYSTLNTGIGSKDPLGGGGDWFTQGTIVANITELLKSRTVLENTISVLKLDTTPEKLGKRITVSRMGQAGLLKVEAEAESAEAAAELVNTNVREFLRYYITTQSHEARSGNEFLRSQVKSAQDRLTRAENKLKAFKGTYVPEMQADVPVRVADLIAQRDEAARNLAAAQAGLSAVSRELNAIKRDPMLSQRIINSGAVMTQSEKLRELQMNLMDARDIYGKDSAVVRGLESQIAKAKSQLRTVTYEQAEQNPALAESTARVVNLKAEVAMNAARLSSINASLARMQSQAGPASANQVTYQQLQREVEIAAAQYQDLQTKSGQANLVAQGAANVNLSIVDAAIPPKEPLSSKLALKLILGLILSLGLGLFISYLMSLREKPEEAEAEAPSSPSAKLLKPGMTA